LRPSLPADFVFDPLSTEFFNDPTGVYEVLREAAPVYHDERLDMWVLSRFEDVSAALRDWEVFSSASGVTLHQALDDDFDGSNVMMMMDPPQHTRLRSLVSRAFSPRAIVDSECLVRKVVRDQLELLDSATEFDAVADFAEVFPVNVICSILGIPAEDSTRIRDWFSAILHREEGDPSMTPAGLEAAIASGMYFHDIAGSRRAEPEDDMISRLCEATIETEDGRTVELEQREVAGFVILLAGAGTETVTKLVGSAIVLLDHIPEFKRALAADPSIAPAIVEETMRYAPPAQYMCRTTTRSAELPSGRIPGGARVMLLMGSALRDPRVFKDPDEFLLDREPSVALGFGCGVHTCLGAALARLEGRVALEEFIGCWPDYRVNDSELVRVTQENTAGYSHVPVRVRGMSDRTSSARRKWSGS
jgi:cytochrome P450